MSYRESELICDWCSSSIGHKESVACRDYYEKLEDEVANPKKELELLRLESLPELKKKEISE